MPNVTSRKLEDTCVMALVKPNGERYVFLFEPHRKGEVLRQLGRWASNEDLSFTWYDAAMMSERVRLMTCQR